MGDGVRRGDGDGSAQGALGAWREAPNGSVRWGGIGAALGLVLAVVDMALMVALGVEMRLGGYDATLGVGIFLATSFAGFGYTVGRLVEARRRLMRSRRVILAQLEALEASQARLVQSEKLAGLGRLAAGVAHEVRNPLGVIRASASMMMEDVPPGGEGYQAGEFICEEVDRLSAFVSALMDFSKPLQVRRGAMDPLDVAEQARRRAAEAARDAGVEVRVEAAAGIGPGAVALADANLWTQALLGLVLNAVQVLGEEGGEAVVVRVSREARGVWLWDVADDGPGIDPDDAARVMEPFYTTRADGTGLGLAMVQRVIEAHGGALEVIQGAGLGEGGRGACLRARLPGERAGLGVGGGGAEEVLG